MAAVSVTSKIRKARSAPDERAIARLVLAWYDEHARALPWRVLPAERAQGARADPYRVWLSEIMLQQTTVAAVKPYFRAFTERWPDLAALASADEAEILAAWAGLGYYSRARNLHKAAQAVMREHGGQFPTSYAELKRLPGIGDYTAAAIAAICFDEPVAVIDANVERVTARLFAIDTPLPAGRKAIRTRAEAITPRDRPGDFAQAMMDLGAQICRARSALYDRCPLAGACMAARLGDPLAFPVKPEKKARPQRLGHALWIMRGHELLLLQRPSAGMLGGMMALPDDDWQAAHDGRSFGGKLKGAQFLGAVSHGFTHFSLELSVYALDGAAVGGKMLAQKLIAQAEGEGRAYRWVPLANIGEAGLPTLYAKAAQLALAQQA